MKPRYISITRLAIALLFVLGLLAQAGSLAHAVNNSDELDTTAIDAFVQEQVTRHGIPGMAIGIVEGDRIAYLRGFGQADDGGRPVTAQTPFVLASTSKPLTALAVMQLVESGRIELDAPAQRYLPEFRFADAAASARITVRHLLNHTSGMPVTICDTKQGATTLEQYVAELRTVELVAEPGTKHNYCSGNYNVLGRIIEVETGQDFGRYMQQHIFTPLDMRHSFTVEEAAQQAGLAQGYQWVFGLRLPTDHEFNTSQLPSGYIISSAEDMAHFLIAQLNGGEFGSSSVLSPAGIAALQAPGVATGAPSTTYGLGWKNSMLAGVPTINHDGVNFDFHSLLFIEPQTRRGAVLLTNSFSIVAYSSAFKEIEDGLVQLVAGRTPAAAPGISLGTLYLIIDAPLLLLLFLALLSLLQLGRWDQKLRERLSGSKRRIWPSYVRSGLEIGGGLLLLGGSRLLLDMLGAQSWAEGFAGFPDFTLWILATSALLLLTGVVRLALLVRALQKTSAGYRRLEAKVAES